MGINYWYEIKKFNLTFILCQSRSDANMCAHLLLTNVVAAGLEITFYLLITVNV